MNKKTYDNNILELINVIIKQLYYRDTYSTDKYDINDILYNEYL